MATQPATLLWSSRPLPGTIAAGEAHVWAWNFAGPSQPTAADLKMLDENERQRTARFYFVPDRVRYSACHANMRRILASYLGRAPASLVFREGPGGKPELGANPSDPPLRFNLSHSRSVALLAVALEIELGVDVENIRPIERAVAERFFSPAELAAMANLDGEPWLDAFYRCWTRKEAVLKAEGVGLRTPLDSFDVSVVAEQPAALLAARPESRFTANWRLHHLAPAEGTMAALAVADEFARIVSSALAL